MSGFIPWNSQPLEETASRHAGGKFVDLRGRKTHYIDRGQGDPILLIHGFNLDSTTWLKNVEPLAERFRVLAPDLWGVGFSTREPLDYGYGLYSEQVRLFMDALGIERASLVGHSMGGGISTVYALEHPQRVEKLVLVDSAGIPTPLPIRTRLFRLPGIAELLLWLPTDMVRRKNLGDLWFYDSNKLTEEAYQALIRFQKIEATTEALLSILRRDFFHTLAEAFEALGKRDIPALVIWGREDVAVPLDSGQEIHRLLEGSRLVIIDDAGHMPNFERPEVFNRLVLDFLTARAP